MRRDRNILADLRVLYHILRRASSRGESHAERLDHFYSGQAQDYDHFRERLLQGREEMMSRVAAPEDGVWIDMGGGTGSNLEAFGPRLSKLRKVYVVDLCPSLLAVARKRIAERGWRNVEAVEADATSFVPAEGRAALITFSYSLTMIPNWFMAIDHAHRLLAPAGQIGIVDFYVARKHPENGNAVHPWRTRAFWPLWFAADNVFPGSDHLPYLQYRFNQQCVCERRAAVPYMPFFRVPYYIFTGSVQTL